MTNPVPFVPPEIVRTLDLSESPDARHIGYWRDTIDGSDGYETAALRSAERDLESYRKTGKPPYYNGQMIDEPYLERMVEMATRRRDASAMLPWPGDHCDPSMPEAERHRLAEILYGFNAKITVHYAGHSWDRLDWPHDSPPWKCFYWANALGSGEVKHGGMVWPEGLFRYVQEHGLVLPDEFWASVLA